MGARLVHFVVLNIELALLAALGAMLAGVLPLTTGQLCWSWGVLLATAGGLAFGLPVPGKASRYGALACGLAVFMLPVLWLASTSIKQPEETFVFPPKWLPATSAAPTASPWTTEGGEERSLELGEVRVRYADGSEREAQVHWEAQGSASLSAGKVGQVVAYRFDGSRESVSIIGNLSGLSADAPVESVAVRMRPDESWHSLAVTVDCAGAAWQSSDVLSLGAKSWIEWSFSMVPTDPQERSAGVWPLHRIGEAREGTRIELTIGQRSRAMATAVKWTQSYRDAWYADRNWPSYMGKSVLLVALNVVGQMLACSMAAFALSRIQWPGRELCFGIILMTMMLPGVVVMIPQFLIFRWLGWYGTLLPLWVPAFTGAPFFIFMLRQFMLTVPKDLEEAARIDGCSWFGIYWRVMLPLMRPALCAVAIFTFMGTWNDFMGPLLYLNDKRSYPLSVGLFGFRAEHLGEFNMLMAASMLMTVPAMALFFLAQRYFIEGITLSGLK